MHDEPRQWHPLMAAVEGPPAEWTMVDPQGRAYARITLRRVNGGADLRYRVERDGELLGWATTLTEACRRAHIAYLSAHGPGGGPIASWGARR